jgi:membrane associated rhomboid family serine protease
MPETKRKINIQIQKTRFFIALFISTFLVMLMWLSFVFEQTLGLNFAGFGIYPGTLHGLVGIIFSPFIHANFKHIFSNTFPFWILCTTLLFFYPRKGLVILGIITIGTGIFTWLIGRQAYHIGASGIIYGLAAFIFFSGVLSRQRNYIAISLIVVFLYGSLIWGIFPSLNQHISWEGHLGGFTTGTILSLIYHPRIYSSQNKNINNIFADYVYNFNYISSSKKNQNIFYIYKKFHSQKQKYHINEKHHFTTDNTDVYNWGKSTKTIL